MKEEVEKAWTGWEEAGQNPLKSGAGLRNPKFQQPFAVQNIALKPPFNGKALQRIMAFSYCHSPIKPQRTVPGAWLSPIKVLSVESPLPTPRILVS